MHDIIWFPFQPISSNEQHIKTILNWCIFAFCKTKLFLPFVFVCMVIVVVYFILLLVFLCFGFGFVFADCMNHKNGIFFCDLSIYAYYVFVLVLCHLANFYFSFFFGLVEMPKAFQYRKSKRNIKNNTQFEYNINIKSTFY